MEVIAVRAGARPLEYRHENDLLTVRFPGAGRPGELDSLTVSYRGAPASGLRIGPNKYGERTFFSDNWPNRARNWLPTVDHVAEKAACEFVVTAPAHYQVVSNGVVIEETDLPGGMRRTHWRQSAPISPWLFVVGVARFAVQNLGEFNGKPVQTWVYARDRDAGFHDFAVPTFHVLAFFDDYVGPFAYEKLANITSPATGGGMEAATALMYSENAVTGGRPVRWRNVVIHEIAHQWFGNAVTESEWDDVWLSEGFATYFTLLFREHAYGRDDFVAGLEQAAERVRAWYEENPDYRIVHDGLEDMSRVTSVATYQKGAWVLHMLRQRIGDEAFRRGIRTYYARHLNGHGLHRRPHARHGGGVRRRPAGLLRPVAAARRQSGLRGVVDVRPRCRSGARRPAPGAGDGAVSDAARHRRLHGAGSGAPPGWSPSSWTRPPTASRSRSRGSPPMSAWIRTPGRCSRPSSRGCPGGPRASRLSVLARVHPRTARRAVPVPRLQAVEYPRPVSRTPHRHGKAGRWIPAR